MQAVKLQDLKSNEKCVIINVHFYVGGGGEGEPNEVVLERTAAWLDPWYLDKVLYILYIAT